MTILYKNIWQLSKFVRRQNRAIRSADHVIAKGDAKKAQIAERSKRISQQWLTATRYLLSARRVGEPGVRCSLPRRIQRQRGLLPATS
jgi:hypothetical protein